jgi:RHS repeat-associated protein
MGTVRYTVIDGEVIAEKRGGVRKQYVPDPLGSTVALLDSTQKKTDTFDCWPYGEESSRTGTTPTPFRYVGTAGYYRDAVERNYVRARYLDSRLGRWISEDSVGYLSDWNLFRYTNAKPTILIDPSGLQGINVCGLAEALGLHWRPGETGPDFGGVICYKGEKFACSWYHGPSNVIDQCIKEHEKDHFDVVRCKPDDPCPRRPGGTYPPRENFDSEECKAHAEEVRCLLRNCMKDPEGVIRSQCFERISLLCMRTRDYCAKSGRPSEVEKPCKVFK